MSSPAVAIANWIEAVSSRGGLTGMDLRVLLQIVRHSYCEGRGYADLTLGQIASGAQMQKVNVCRVLKKLVRDGIITRDNAPLSPVITMNRFTLRVESQIIITRDNAPLSPVITQQPGIITRDNATLISNVNVNTKRTTTPTSNTGNINGETPDFLKPMHPEPPADLASRYLSGLRQKRDSKAAPDLPEPVRKLLLCYKATLGPQQKANPRWDGIYFKKHAADADDLLDVFEGNLVDAVRCLGELVGEFRAKNFSFTLATIVKHATEWRYKNVTASKP